VAEAVLCVRVLQRRRYLFVRCSRFEMKVHRSDRGPAAVQRPNRATGVIAAAAVEVEGAECPASRHGAARSAVRGRRAVSVCVSWKSGSRGVCVWGRRGGGGGRWGRRVCGVAEGGRGAWVCGEVRGGGGRRAPQARPCAVPCHARPWQEMVVCCAWAGEGQEDEEEAGGREARRAPRQC